MHFPSRAETPWTASRVVLALLVLLAAISPGKAAEVGRLNVLFILSDDLRPELGCYGSKLAKTPHIDALATAGVRFDRAYCQFPLCNPSRSSMLTGRHPTTTGVLDNRSWFGAAHPDFVSLPAHFKAHGYTTLRAGKVFHGGIDDADAWSEGGEARKLGGGAPEEETEWIQVQAGAPPLSKAENSDRFIVLESDGERHGDAKVAARTIDFLRAHRDEPFFLACGFEKPHSPPAAPREFYDLYDLETIPLPVSFAPRPTVPEGFPKMSMRKNSDLFIGRDATPEAAREMIRAYLASVSFVDENVGRVLAELDRLGLREKTVVVFWGDHGYHLGEMGKWSKAGSLFELGARLPLIIAAPKARGNGQPSPRVVQSIDIFPTLADLCGLPQPAELEGRSLRPLLADPEAAWDFPAYTVWSEDARGLSGVAVRTARWRYAEYGGGAGGAMLFDHDADPDEVRNLADDPALAPVRAELSALVKKYASHMSTQ